MHVRNAQLREAIHASLKEWKRDLGSLKDKVLGIIEADQARPGRWFLDRKPL